MTRAEFRETFSRPAALVVWDARFIKNRKGRLTDKQGYLAIESTLHLADAPPPS